MFPWLLAREIQSHVEYQMQRKAGCFCDGRIGAVAKWFSLLWFLGHGQAEPGRLQDLCQSILSKITITSLQHWAKNVPKYTELSQHSEKEAPQGDRGADLCDRQ